MTEAGKFAWKQGDATVSQCARCVHKTDLGCPAFPAGIPAVILLNHHDHRGPYPGDGGIMFEQAREA